MQVLPALANTLDLEDKEVLSLSIVVEQKPARESESRWRKVTRSRLACDV
jgi:hypothetical protein